MKLSELRAICPGGDALERMRDRPEWVKYVTWNELMDMAARSREPAAYEAEQRRLFAADLPDALVRHVLAASPVRFYESGARIATTRTEPGDVEITALDVFERFGGSVLKDAQDHGVIQLNDTARRRGGQPRATPTAGHPISPWRRFRRGR